jgi:hypothetical protein
MKKQKKPNLVVLGILTLITILFWIGFSAYRSFTSEVPIKVPSEILEPISPTFDTETLSKVGNRLFFLEQELAEIVLTAPSPSPTASPEPTQLPEEQEEATESATNETNEATESGDIIE